VVDGGEQTLTVVDLDGDADGFDEDLRHSAAAVGVASLTVA
jgi:hypothetical protein